MRALSLLFLTSAALADASISAGEDLSRCTMNDSPFRKLGSDPRVQKLKPASDLTLRDLRGKYLLYSTQWTNGPARSVLVDTDGHQMPVIFGPTETQLVMDERGELYGILALHGGIKGARRLFAPDGRTLWGSSGDLGSGDSAATLVAGDLLLIASFHRIATGSSLAAVELKTGKLRWQADVVQLNVAHSKYYNDVSLERLGETIVMRGYEAAGCYRQTFDLATGKRLSAQLPK